MGGDDRSLGPSLKSVTNVTILRSQAKTYTTVTTWTIVVVNVVTVTGVKLVMVEVAAVAVTDTVNGGMMTHEHAEETLAVNNLEFTAVKQASVEGGGLGALGLRLTLTGATAGCCAKTVVVVYVVAVVVEVEIDTEVESVVEVRTSTSVDTVCGSVTCLICYQS